MENRKEKTVRNWMGFRLGWFFANNNNRCLALWAFTALIFIFALFSGFGKPILSSSIENELRATSEAQYHQTWGAPEKDLPAKSPEVSLMKSWLIWIIFTISFVISAVYTPIALREEVSEAWEEAKEWLREKHESEAEAEKIKPAEAVAETAKKASAEALKALRPSAKRLFGLDLLAEFIWGFLSKAFSSAVGGRR